MQLVSEPATLAPPNVAVCFACSYQCQEQGSACPQCNFPLITRSEASPAGGIRLADVFQRESIRIGAPPLPGVDAAPRQAQQLAEARKARQLSPPLMPVPSDARVPLVNLLLVCLCAVGIGVAAAAMQSVI